MFLVRFGHVLDHGGVRAFAVAARVGRDTLSGREALHRGRGEAHIDAVFDVRMRHRVIVPVDFDVVVDVDARLLPVCVFVTIRGQGFERGFVQGFEL